MDSLSKQMPFDGLIAAVAPAQRRLLAKDIAFALRTMNAQRIAQQRNPDGSAFKARAPQRRLRKKKRSLGKMFTKIRTLKHLRRRYNDSGAEIVFTGRSGLIAANHHYGLRAYIGAGVYAKMPRRELLGFGDDGLEFIEDSVLNHLAEAYS